MNVDELADRLQRAAERHLDECWAAYYAAEEQPDPSKWPESPAQAPFCGCQTCLVREVLHAAAEEIERCGWAVQPKAQRPLPREDDVDEHLNPGPPRYDPVLARADDFDAPTRDEL